MNVLSIEKRAQILQLLVEGMSMRAVTRVTSCSLNTVTKLLIDAGKVCAEYQAANIRNVKAKRVQCDEIWSFCQSKQKNVSPEYEGILGHGDVWTWVALDADSKLAINWLVGLRTMECAEAFMGDLATRLSDRIQLTTDVCQGYPNFPQFSVFEYSPPGSHFGLFGADQACFQLLFQAVRVSPDVQGHGMV